MSQRSQVNHATRAEMAPFKLPVLSRTDALLANRFCTRLRDVALPVGERRLRLDTLRLWRAPRAPGPRDGLRLSVTVGGHSGHLVLPHPIVAAATGDVCATLPADDPIVAIMLEAAFADPLDALERTLGLPIRWRAGEAVPAAKEFALVCDAGTRERPLPLALFLDGPALVALADDLGAIDEHRVWGWPDLAECPVPSSLVLARSRLTIGELRRLGRGDVVISDGTLLAALEPAPSGAVIERYGTLTRRARLVDGVLGTHENDSGMDMNQQADAPHSFSDGTLEELELTLSFEIDRQPITLAALGRLAPGSVLETRVSIADPVTLRVNGRAIGRGSLVAIGDAVGVRVERIHEGAAASSALVDVG